jgi:hypothetical protein
VVWLSVDVTPTAPPPIGCPSWSLSVERELELERRG